MNKDPRERRATLLALTAVLFWATVATAFKLSLRVLSPLQLLLGASFTAALSLLVILAVTGRLRELASLSRRDLAISAGLGLLNPFVYYLILFRAYDLLPAQQAQPLNMTWGVILALLAVPLLGQRLTLRSLGALLLALAGVMVISTEGRLGAMEFTSPIGVALALGSAFLWALYWIANTRDRCDPLVRLLLNFGFGFMFTLAWWLLQGAPLPANPMGWTGAIYVGLFEMGITFFLWLRAMRLTRSAARIGILVYIAPFLSLVLIHFVLGEHVLPASFIGLVMIVAGILWQRGGSERSKVESRK
ncbi:MAG TPA: DMT family transporter [Candidatus Aminicenantes bacterium]|nr:DMT family transporter [Candidatus Aminicenantes bacterium]